MFQFSAEEEGILRSQSVISKTPGRGGRRYRPYAFTEHGVTMLSSVLNSPRAVQVNIEIMRTFSRLRQLLASHAELSRRIARLEKEYDACFRVVRAKCFQIAPDDRLKREWHGRGGPVPCGRPFWQSQRTPSGIGADKSERVIGRRREAIQPTDRLNCTSGRITAMGPG